MFKFWNNIVYLSFCVLLLLESSVFASLRPPFSFEKSGKLIKKEQPTIRVLIGRSLSNVGISGLDLKRKLFSGDQTKIYSGRKRLRFNCNNLSKRGKLPKRTVLLASIASLTGLVSVEGHKYQGKISVLTSRDYKSCDVVNELSIETYLASLLSKEMNGVWPLEALKAQAVAARSYALHKIESRQVSRGLGHEAFYDLESSEKHQVGGTFFDVTAKTYNASKLTQGEILVTKKGNLTPIFFHAKCGGRTLHPRQVWDNKVEGYKSVKCPHCEDHGKKAWKTKISNKRVSKFILWAIKKHYLKGINEKDVIGGNRFLVAPDRMKNYKLRFYLGELVIVLEKTLLRRFFGRKIISSNNFVAIQKKGELVLNGKGKGHGVGMCQLGALHLAKLGWGHQRILKYYFPEHVLKKIY